MTITIDIREHEFIQFCSDHKIDIKTDSLEVGDILLETETDALVFERKTLSDLAASIKDGRFREQKQRLKSRPAHRVTYIIEGVSFEKLASQPNTYGIASGALLSAMISLSYRDGYHVIHTKSLPETIRFLQEIHTRMIEHPEKVKRVQSEATEETYMASLKVKTKKIDNITPQLCYALQLSQIPGISTKLAKDIIVSYPTLSLLLAGLTEKGIKALKDVPGIGNKKAQTILDYLLI
jgi:ERCC4-type nuclease